MSLGTTCVACGQPLPEPNGRKLCDACPHPKYKRTARLQAQVEALAARCTRLGDLVQQREREVAELKQRLAEAELTAEQLKDSNIDLRLELQRQYQANTEYEMERAS